MRTERLYPQPTNVDNDRDGKTLWAEMSGNVGKCREMRLAEARNEQGQKDQRLAEARVERRCL
jgi:hypothetical protein